MSDATFDDSSRSHPKAEAQELAIPHPRHRTLGGVDLKPELRVEADQRLHDSLRRSLRPHVHIAVIGVARKAVSASLQLLIHLVQQHIRQER